MALFTANFPHIHFTKSSPKYGIAKLIVHGYRLEESFGSSQ
jgi:hypothetical protein